jgi:hypothetical protein
VNLTREQVEARIAGAYVPRIVGQRNAERGLLVQLLATMDALTTAEARIEALDGWKREALAVEAEWNPQEVAWVLGIPLGTPIRGNILAAVRALRERALASEARIEAALAIVTSENCHQPVNVAAILRGDHDTKGERL